MISGGYDQNVAITTFDGDVIDKWSMSPLPSALPSVNPPFVICLEECKSNGNIYCGCGDGSIRLLTKSKNEHLANAVVNVHKGSVSDVLIVLSE